MIFAGDHRTVSDEQFRDLLRSQGWPLPTLLGLEGVGLDPDQQLVVVGEAGVDR